MRGDGASTPALPVWVISSHSLPQPRGGSQTLLCPTAAADARGLLCRLGVWPGPWASALRVKASGPTGPRWPPSSPGTGALRWGAGHARGLHPAGPSQSHLARFHPHTWPRFPLPLPPGPASLPLLTTPPRSAPGRPCHPLCLARFSSPRRPSQQWAGQQEPSARHPVQQELGPLLPPTRLGLLKKRPEVLLDVGVATTAPVASLPALLPALLPTLSSATGPGGWEPHPGPSSLEGSAQPSALHAATSHRNGVGAAQGPGAPPPTRPPAP